MDVPCGLGVELKQTGDGPAGGEVVLLNSNYTNTRFGFAYAWWQGRSTQLSFFGIYHVYSLSLDARKGILKNTEVVIYSLLCVVVCFVYQYTVQTLVGDERRL